MTMSREIKFRAWDKEKNIMLYDVSVYSTGGGGIDYDDAVGAYGSISNLPEEQGEEWVFLLHHDIMQSTGLKDKNGKEIYEGDIVVGNSLMEDKQISFVEYAGHGFWIHDESFGWEGETLWDWNELIVIGNIYENAKLLNSDKNDAVSDTTEVEKSNEAGKQINPL